MSGSEDDTEKTFDATPQKLLEARKKGEIAKSNDLLAAAAYAGLLIALAAFGVSGLRHLGAALAHLIERADALGPLFFDGSAKPLTAQMIIAVFQGLAPVFVLPALAVMAALAAQRAVVFAPSKLVPKASRLSIVSNAKNKFGRSGLFEFCKSFVKLLIYSVCLFVFLRARLNDMITVLQTDPFTAISLLSEICLAFLFVVVLVSGGIGVIDAIWQHFEHLRKNRMSRKEIMDETKSAEGDPHVKQQRRQKAHDIVSRQIMVEVPKADVIIVNPTHFAVALRWDRKPGQAPICVAKGVDETALRIRQIATEHFVPIHSDPPTARALHATTEIGEQIAPDHYRAVAAAIRFAEAMRQKAKGRG
jgi:flagellar biosynthetic protein FlhB